jgi:hypothetical protein
MKTLPRATISRFIGFAAVSSMAFFGRSTDNITEHLKSFC